jgi:transposase-like protein
MPQMLLPIFSSEVTLINQLIGFSKRDGRIYYFNGQMPIFVHDEGDLNSFKMFMAQLFVTGIATQTEINKVFGLNPINMKRWSKRYRECGPGAFYQRETKRTPRVMTPEIIDTAQALLDEAHTGKEVAEVLGLKANTLRKAIQGGKLHQSKDLKKSRGPK